MVELLILLAKELQQEEEMWFQLCEWCGINPLLPLQYCVCIDDCSSSNCMCGQLSMRCWYDKVSTHSPLLDHTRA